MLRNILLALLLLSCSKANLEPIPPAPPPEVDNLLTIRGEVCSEPPDIAPFPVKILFAIDQSASLQCTDPENRRFVALNRVFNQLSALPNAYFGFLGFASWSRKQPFTRDMSKLSPFLDANQGGGPATDYQGALASILQMLEQDMIDAGPAQRARSRYVVVFISDGVPEPRCRQGCEDDRNTCSDGRDNDGDGLIDGMTAMDMDAMPDMSMMPVDSTKTCEELKRERAQAASAETAPEDMMSTMDPDCAHLNDASKRPDILYGVCNTDREIPDGVYVDMSGRCPAYNQPRQILQRVEEIKTLSRIYSVGELVMHTVFLGASQEDIDAVCGTAALSFGYEACAAKDLLTEMAKTGGGTFRDVNIGQDDANFLDYDYNSLKTPYHATAFVAYNENAQHSQLGLRADSDGDGIADDDERTNGTDPYNTDSDGGDGYGDLFEQRYKRNGFNPTDDTVPALICEDPVDSDGDGINDCEEAFLETDPRNPDTDGDRILDGIELRVGTAPNEADSDRDPDFDGVINRSEVQGNTDPNSIDGDRFLKERVRYTVTDVGERDILNTESEEMERRRCYDFEIARMELAATTQPQDPGRNRILLHILGQPLGLSGSEGIVRQACVEVQYSGPTSKNPLSGTVEMNGQALTDLHEGFDKQIQRISQCMATDELGRPDLEDLVLECLPPRLRLGDYLFDRDEVIEMVRRYYERNLSSKVPVEPSDFFVPIELFDADSQCFRAWEIPRVTELLTAIADRCGTCAWVKEQTEGPSPAQDDDSEVNEEQTGGAAP